MDQVCHIFGSPKSIKELFCKRRLSGAWATSDTWKLINLWIYFKRSEARKKVLFDQTHQWYRPVAGVAALSCGWLDADLMWTYSCVEQSSANTATIAILYYLYWKIIDMSEIVNPAEGREFKSRLEQVLALVTQWLECRSYERFKFGFVFCQQQYFESWAEYRFEWSMDRRYVLLHPRSGCWTSLAWEHHLRVCRNETALVGFPWKKDPFYRNLCR